METMHRKKKKNGFRRDVTVEGEKVTFFNLDHRGVVSKFMRGMKTAVENGIKKFTMDFSPIREGVFPNVAVPLSAIFCYYIRQGYAIQFKNMPHFFEYLNFPIPREYDDESNVLNKIWVFSSDDIGKIVKAYREELTRSDRFPKGFINATEWAIYEVMDNVINHSGTDCGYVMGQVHPTSKHVAFTVFDLGQGIYNSFKHSGHNPENPVAAIKLSLEESVTRDKKIGQGNGLFGLSSLIKLGDSRLKITSGEGYYSWEGGNSQSYDTCPVISEKVCMTTVDFMLDYSKDRAFENALVFNGNVHLLPTLFVEDIEDIDGNVLIDIKNQSKGTGTRKAASELKNLILNILQEEPKHIVLDFSGIEVISSSYADELLAKLFCTLGLFQFSRLIKIIGLSTEQQMILQRSVIQRIVEDYDGEPVLKKP